MDVASLKAFLAVAEHGSFSTASAQLFLTQPAISKRIAVLESELDTPLFDRIGRQVTLTQAGKALLPRAQKILLEIEDSTRAIRNLSGDISGLLSIGTSHHIGLHRLPPVLRAFTKAYPEVELDIHFMDSEEACRAVEHGELELGVVTLPLQAAPVLQTKLVWPDPLCVIVGKGHPLAQQKQLSFKQLAEHKAVLPARGTFTREIIEQAFGKHRVHVNISLSTNYLETIKMLVSVGLGWSVLPESMLSRDIVAIPTPGLKLKRELGIVWHKARTLSNAAQALRTQLLQTF
ncbi:MAG: LysR family transcriptional regulator [Gammaproteobacteria bacterium]|nr:LysR family transcriptional regulator [Gammaproteobacteria bacterium]